MAARQSTHRRIQSIYLAAIDISDVGARSGYIDEACRGDEEVRRGVEQLLAVESAGHFDPLNRALCQLNPRLEDGANGDCGVDVSQHPVIDRYKLLEEIGRGGMGTVYMAQQVEPVRRRVALKVINPGMDSREVIARFEAERQALAMMDHPNIARVLDAGTTAQGRPYFVMELVRGIPITEYCDKHKLTLDDRLELFIDVCQAVQHAHQKGIIHRDLKPSNVQITNHDGKPVVKVIDFGVAKALNQELTDRTLYTQFSQLVGTPLYMSPEQADRHGIDIDTRSDVYSLGVLLYEILTSTTPFARDELSKAGIDGARRMICEVEPPRPSLRVSTLKAADDSTLDVAREQGARRRKLGLALRGDLDWIVMKALAKDRNDRYESSSAFSQDIQRHLENEPIEAKPPTIFTRLGKWSRRHVALVWSLLAIAAILTVALGVSTAAITASRNSAREERDQAKLERQKAEDLQSLAIKQRDAARKNLYRANIATCQIDLANNNISGLRSSPRSNQYFPIAGEQDYRGWEWYYFLSRCHPEQRTLVVWGSQTQPSWSPDGKYLGASGTIWRADTFECIRQFDTSDHVKLNTAWSPDGRKFAWTKGLGENAFYIWDSATDSVVRYGGQDSQFAVWGISWSPDSTRIASGSTDQRLRVLDVATGDIEWSLDMPDNVSGLAWSPDTKLIAVGIWRSGVAIFDAKKYLKVAQIDGLRPLSISWRPQGDVLAVGGDDHWRLLNTSDWTVKHVEKTHRGCFISFSPDGQRFAVGEGELVSVWDYDSLEPTADFRGHRRLVTTIAWSPDGRRLASGASRDEIKVWDLERANQIGVFETEIVKPSIDWGIDGTSIVTLADQKHFYSQWDTENGQAHPACRLGRQAAVLALQEFSPSGDLPQRGQQGCHP